MATVVPNEKATKDAINQFNLEMRQQPWYQQWFQERGLDANKVKLSKEQRKQLEQTAIANGAPKDAFDDMMIDPAGNLNTEHGFASLPTWAKIAIGAGAAAGGFFAAPAIGGALGIGGGTTGTAAGTAGIGAGGTAAGTVGVGSSVGAGTLGTIGGVAGTGLSTMDKIGSLLGAGSRAVGAATESAAQRQAGDTRNQYTADSQNEQNRLAANAQNISGESAFQNQQQSMAQLEAAQQEAARKNLYRASVMKNPTVSVENQRGAPTFSPEMIEGLTNLEKAALTRTGTTQYSTAQMRAPRDYQPYSPQALSVSSQPSTMQTIGGWLAPALSIGDMVRKVF